MKQNCLGASLFLLLFCFAAGSTGIANPQVPQKASKQIEVKLLPKTKVLHVGEVLEVQVEIWNVGSQEIFIEKTVHQLCADSPLSLTLELGPPLKPRPGHGCAADCADNPKEDFTSRLVERWIPLPAGHFYGAVVRMDPDFFPQLETPGRWRLGGKYESSGDLSHSFCAISPMPLNPEQIAKLPYKGWQGKEEANKVWIEVLPKGRPTKTKP